MALNLIGEHFWICPSCLWVNWSWVEICIECQYERDEKATRIVFGEKAEKEEEDENGRPGEEE